MNLEIYEKTLRDLEDKLRERQLTYGLDTIRSVSDRSDYSKLLTTFMEVNSKIMHLDDFMPTKLQQELLDRGLDILSDVIPKDQFKFLSETVNKINGIEVI